MPRRVAILKKCFLPMLVAGASAFPFHGAAQVLLYEETFPWPGPSGNFAVSAAGWAAAIPNNPQRLFQITGSDGAVFAFQANSDVPITTGFYTTSSLDNGSTGMAFPVFDPSRFVGLSFSVDIRPNFDPDNVAARFAVQMSGSNWYASTTTLPVPDVVGGFATYTQPFTAAASAWNNLFFTPTNATIGPLSSGALTGKITGAGMVFTHTTDNGTHDFDNYRITAAMGPLNAALLPSGLLSLTWLAAPNIRLTSSPELLAHSWEDVTNTLGASSALVPTSADQMFFQLSPGSTGSGTSSNLANFGFDADGAPVVNPSGWTTTGTLTASGVIGTDAYAGGYCLQHSNNSAYQVQTTLLVTNLANGIYRLGAHVKSSGGQLACYLSGNSKLTSLPPLTNWSETVVRGVSVTNGQCLIQICSDASAGNWCRVDSLTLTNDGISYNFLKGGDISELTYVEQNGGKFYETNGIQMDCLQILKNHGFNIARLRLYNDPGNTNYLPSKLLPPGIQSPTNILDLAARAKAKGMQLELTFYYSDYWTNGKPHDWVAYSVAQLSNAVFQFTTNFMTLMKNQGTTPEYVSLGNEIAGGILLPEGSSSTFPQLAQFLKAGYAGIKTISPSSQVILHTDKVDAPNVQWFFNNCVSNGVQWDIIGCSYYPFWTGLTSEQARTNIDQFYSSFNKPVLIMETGYNWSTNACDGYPGQLSNNGPETFPSTPLGQKNFLLKCFNDLKLVESGHCIGDLYWDPIFICVPGLGWQLGARNVVDNTTLFDFTGHALPSLDAFNYNN
jgi:arabinogalactan endo-1,4-beta-galactosidase